MLYRALFLFLFATLVFAATQRLYLKDGTYHLIREYQVQQDRVRYYSTERGDWEEIPLELVDLDRTKKEAAEQEAELATDAKERAAEDAAVREAQKQVERIPVEPGVYYIHGDKLEAMKLADIKIVNNKRRSILKTLSPVPIVPGKATVEVDGEHAAFHVANNRPEFYFRLSDYEGFEIIKLMPKKDVRVAENLSILKIQTEQQVEEVNEKIKTFKKQEGDLLYKIWPESPLEPGEYALIQYTEGKIDPQIWDFSVGSSK